MRCDARQVYIVNSAQRGLELVCRLLLEDGDAAAVEDPGYPGAWSALASAGARVVPVAIDHAGLDVSALNARRGVRGLVLRSTRTGLHAVGELAGVDADRVCHEAGLRGVELAAISDYTLRAGTHTQAVALGFGAVSPASLDRGMQELASAIEAARRTRAA